LCGSSSLISFIQNNNIRFHRLEKKQFKGNSVRILWIGLTLVKVTCTVRLTALVWFIFCFLW